MPSPGRSSRCVNPRSPRARARRAGLPPRRGPVEWLACAEDEVWLEEHKPTALAQAPPWVGEPQHRNNRYGTRTSHRFATATFTFMLRFEKRQKPRGIGLCCGVALKTGSGRDARPCCGRWSVVPDTSIRPNRSMQRATS